MSSIVHHNHSTTLNNKNNLFYWLVSILVLRCSVIVLKGSALNVGWLRTVWKKSTPSSLKKC